ncbi:hypothetical protein CDV55_101875 [Aspergillus turcosus]|uniref:Uncharacterized protein n=1 Tax=Aspergillus turcosus TaxID=1245748 RepID=A0A229YGD7_9EURO|nr:hypothetical protein CDV55_101875 [Aspergillus turcosus]RLL96267.1 hypothetical protein CFD26_103686 [Aspergillus turcosus]
MLPLLFVTVFLAAGVTANQAAGKWQALSFYHLYRLDVDAHGPANSRMAPGCAEAGVVCDMEAFMKEVCRVKTGPERDANGKIIKPPGGGRPKLVTVPDFDKVDWARIGEGADLEVFSEEFDKSGFKGDFDNEKLFKDWKLPNNFKNVMGEAQDVGTKAIDKLKDDGREPADDRVNKLTAALKAHADARRYDQARRIAGAFEEYMRGNKFSVAYTDPIERPPVPGYRKIDVDKTISDNKGKSGFDKVEQKVRDYVSKYNSAGQSLSHVEAITETDGIHDHFAEACKA